MAYKPIQQLVKHSANCLALNGMNGDQPWCCPEYVDDWSFAKERVGRDLSGRKNPKARHSWVVFRCIDTSCPAKLAIYWLKFESLLGLSDDQWKQQEEAE